jgi:hypothetical protein
MMMMTHFTLDGRIELDLPSKDLNGRQDSLSIQPEYVTQPAEIRYFVSAKYVDYALPALDTHARTLGGGARSFTDAGEVVGVRFVYVSYRRRF